MHEVLTNEPLRRDLVARGRARLGAFDPEDARATFLEQLLAVV